MRCTASVFTLGRTGGWINLINVWSKIFKLNYFPPRNTNLWKIRRLASWNPEVIAGINEKNYSSYNLSLLYWQLQVFRIPSDELHYVTCSQEIVNFYKKIPIKKVDINFYPSQLKKFFIPTKAKLIIFCFLNNAHTFFFLPINWFSI